jgi:septum formation protein
MQNKKLILASSSPRRSDLLRQIGAEFEVVVSNYEEDNSLEMKPSDLVETFSKAKALDVAKKTKDAVIIAADTVIAFNNKVIGKPKDELDAFQILKTLSGKEHLVITGFTIIDTESQKSITKNVVTIVKFRNIPDHEIDAYIASGEALGKAGAYGIQAKGVMFVESIQGDYTNVIGLPLFSVTQALQEFGIDLL